MFLKFNATTPVRFLEDPQKMLLVLMSSPALKISVPPPRKLALDLVTRYKSVSSDTSRSKACQ